MTMSVSSTTLVIGVQPGGEGGESAQVAEDVNSLVGEYTQDSASRTLYNQNEEHVYRQEGGPWVLYWDEKSAGWWIAEEKNYNITGLFFASGEKEKVPEAGWQCRGLFGVMYYDIPLTISWKKVQEVIEDHAEADAEKPEESSRDVLTIVRAMSEKHWQEFKAVTAEKSAGAQAAAQHCCAGCFDFFTRPDNIAKVKKAIQTIVPLGNSDEPGDEQRFELMPSVATWHGPPRLKKIEATVESSKNSVDPEVKVAADLLRAKEEFIDFFASRAEADGQRSVLIEETLRRKVAKEALETNNGLRCLQLEADAMSAAESHAQEVLKLKTELWEKDKLKELECDQAARNTAKVMELQETLKAAEEGRKEAKAMADDQAQRCVQLEAALREQTSAAEHAGKVEELAASLKDQARAVLEMKEHADQQAQKCAAETRKREEAQALFEEKSARVEELTALTRQAQAEAAEAKAAVAIHSKRSADLEQLLQQAPADGCGQEDVRSLQAEVAKLESQNSNLRHEADTAIAEAQSVIDSYAKRCAELEALLQEAPASGNIQEEVERVQQEADAAVAEAQEVIDDHAKRCAELEALLQDAHTAGGAQDEVQSLRAQLANLEGEYSDLVRQADADAAEAKASAQRCAELQELMERSALTGDSSQKEVLDLREQLAELQELQQNYSDRVQELEAALETQDMQHIQSIEAGLQDQYLGRIQELEAAVQELDAQGASAEQAFNAELDAVNSRWADEMANSQADVAQLATERAELEQEVHRLKAELAKAGSPSRTQGVLTPSGVLSPMIPATATVVSKAAAVALQEARNCPNCGNVYASDSKFCRKCGEPRAGRQVSAPYKTASVAKAPAQSSGCMTRMVAAPTLRPSGHSAALPGQVFSTRVTPASHVVPQGTR
eukprot:TRINITY_DN3227_c0_g1_i1.p1 TRINITY_DN3227_c0_g1~~TRINITY_DN3227_c0_g1_i1.p1  ORF type:complete len:898 (+),score=251.84 TRINITY_DN3227_c0_g1_i1:73-2766(+)